MAQTIYLEADHYHRQPSDPAKPAGSIVYGVIVAVLTLIGHHTLQPHGERLDAPLGQTITLTRTATGWIVVDGTGAYNASKVRIHAQARH